MTLARMDDMVARATLGAPPPKRYRIGELAQYTGLTRQTLHNYTRWGLIHEVGWTPGGHRLYGEEVFPRLAAIRQLKPGNRMQDIRAALDAMERRGQFAA